MMSSRVRRIALAALVTASVTAGCGDATSTDADPAAEQYLQAATPSDCVGLRFNALLDEFDDLVLDPAVPESELWAALVDDVLPAHEELGHAYIGMYQEFLALDWPDHVADDINDLAMEVSHAAAVLFEVARSPDVDTFLDLTSGDFPAMDAAPEVHATLGITRTFEDGFGRCGDLD